MLNSGQTLAVGLSLEEYRWIKDNHEKSIVIECETKSPYIEAVMQRVEKIINMDIKIVESAQIQNNQLKLTVEERELKDKGYSIPFSTTKDGKILKIIETETNSELYNIVSRVIQYINQTQGLNYLKKEIELQINCEKCVEIANEIFKNKKVLIIGYDPSLYPLTYTSHGKAKGVAIEELDLIVSTLGIEAKFVPLDTNQPFDAIALVGKQYNINKTNPYFLMNPVFVGSTLSQETIFINKYFPSFINVIQSSSFNIKTTKDEKEKVEGIVEDYRVYEKKKMKAMYHNYTIIEGRGDETYEACLGSITLSEDQITTINYVIELIGTKEATLYKTIISDQRLNVAMGLSMGVFSLLCVLVIRIWTHRQQKSLKQFQQINQMVKVDKETTQMLYAFADILEGIDDEWYENNVSGHAARVSLFTKCIVNELNLPIEYKSNIIRAAIMHDMGKIEVDKDVLLKKEVLTHEEFQQFQKHCEAGYEIAERCNLNDVVKNVAMYHHEQWDGDGYYGLKGDKIPLEARIVALADIYDSIRVERVYHPSYTHKEATEVILQESGAMIDPYLVEIYNKKQDEFEMIYRKNISL